MIAAIRCIWRWVIKRVNRVIAIGDIHGHSLAVNSLVDWIRPDRRDTLVFLGDYVSRGPDSSGTVERIIRLAEHCNVVSLKGNHEEMLLNAFRSPRDLGAWMSCGGQATLDSYGGTLENLPPEHLDFFRGLQLFYEIESHFFIHANYAPNWRLEDHDTKTALWLSLDDLPSRHYSGKVAVVGHTPQMGGNILDLEHLKCLDTGCGLGGLLSALDVHTGELWQVDQLGNRIEI